MKFIHMSDLHLGKHINQFSMLEDQKYIFNEIVEIIKKEKPNALLLSGDIYDKPIPPVEAVNLLDDFLSKIALEKIPVLIISGNHDSPDRLSFGSSLMKSSQIYISQVYDGNIQCVTLEDENGHAKGFPLPPCRGAPPHNPLPKNIECYIPLSGGLRGKPFAQHCSCPTVLRCSVGSTMAAFLGTLIGV